MNELKCLLDAGLITQEQYELALKFPPGTNQLLRLLAALQASEASAATVISSAEFTKDSLTPGGVTVPDGAKSAVLTVYGNSILYTLDGSTPSSPTGGHYAAALTTIDIENINDFIFMAFDASDDATVFATFYR